MRKIKWGIIGLGNIANKFAQTIKAMDLAVIGIYYRNLYSYMVL